jgi:peptidoglycan glycosyltransferase
MNDQIRRLTVVVVLMFLALMVASTSVQFVQAGDLNADGRNVRTIYREYGRERGPIVVEGTPIVTSEPVDDAYSYLRVYQQPEAYAHVTGYFSVVHSSMTGMERAGNEVLNGDDPGLLLARLQSLFTGSQPRGGAVELTIDPAVQAAAIEGLGDQRGAAVALDPSTGAILAMYSSPSFDPNGLASHDRAEAQAAYDALVADPDRPLLNRAIGGDTYAPGSTFKLVTASAMLESGLDRRASCTTPGRPPAATDRARPPCARPSSRAATPRSRSARSSSVRTRWRRRPRRSASGRTSPSRLRSRRRGSRRT